MVYRRFFKLIRQAHQQRVHQLARLKNLQQQAEVLKLSRESKYQTDLERQRKYEQKQAAFAHNLNLQAQAHENEIQVCTCHATLQSSSISIYKCFTSSRLQSVFGVFMQYCFASLLGVCQPSVC